MLLGMVQVQREPEMVSVFVKLQSREEHAKTEERKLKSWFSHRGYCTGARNRVTSGRDALLNKRGWGAVVKPLQVWAF